MRIIDADRAKEIAEVSLGDIFIQTATKLLIDKVPTLDAVPVVHGRWIAVGGNHHTRISQCTNCCAKYDFRSNYCPNCGAKMDGERKDNA